MNKTILITGNLRTWLNTHDANNQIKEQVHGLLNGFITEMENQKKEHPTPKDMQLFLRDMLDDFIKTDILNRKGEQVSCRKGCSFCCNINVDLTEGEFDVIVDTINEQKLQIDWPLVSHQLSMNIKERGLTKKSACVFLKNNECSIYNTRPNICRMYHVISEPALCDTKSNPHGTTQVPFSIYSELLMSAYITVFEQTSKSLNYRLWASKDRINKN